MSRKEIIKVPVGSGLGVVTSPTELEHRGNALKFTKY